MERDSLSKQVSAESTIVFDAEIFNILVLSAFTFKVTKVQLAFISEKFWSNTLSCFNRL